MRRRKQSTPSNALLTAPHQEKGQADLTFLEGDMCNAANMAYIATELLEHNFSQKDPIGRSQYYLPEDDVEAMLFAVYETHQMLIGLRDRYLSALKSC